MKTSKILEEWGWLALWLLFTITVLWARPPVPVDETRYLSVAWEMWNSNQFLVPHSNGLPYSHKPPLLFWLIHFGWWLFDVNAWSARLTAPLCGLAAIFLSRQLAGRLFPQAAVVRQTTPIILLGMAVWTIYASLTMFDTLLSCTALVGYVCILHAATSRSPFSWPLLGLTIAVGILAKGPVILVYIMPVVLLAPWWTTRQDISWWKWYIGALVSLLTGGLIALAWALPAASAGGEEYGQALLFGQTAGRVVNSFAHQRPFYWYVFLLPLLLFPWSCWLPFWRKVPRPGQDYGIRFLISILIPGFIILSLHLAVANPLHEYLGFPGIPQALRTAEQNQQHVAVYPPRLQDQFQFAGRLGEPLQPLAHISEVFSRAIKAPEDFSLVYFEHPVLPKLPEEAVAAHYKNGWLLFVPSKHFARQTELGRNLLKINMPHSLEVITSE